MNNKIKFLLTSLFIIGLLSLVFFALKFIYHYNSSEINQEIEPPSESDPPQDPEDPPQDPEDPPQDPEDPPQDPPQDPEDPPQDPPKDPKDPSPDPIDKLEPINNVPPCKKQIMASYRDATSVDNLFNSNLRPNGGCVSVCNNDKKKQFYTSNNLCSDNPKENPDYYCHSKGGAFCYLNFDIPKI